MAGLAETLNRTGRAPAAGDLVHVVTLEGPAGPARPDGHGGATVEWVPLDPPGVVTFAAVEDPRLGGMEKLAGEAALSLATDVVILRFHPGVTTKTRIRFGARLLQVIGVVNPRGLDVATIATCAEVVA